MENDNATKQRIDKRQHTEHSLSTTDWHISSYQLYINETKWLAVSRLDYRRTSRYCRWHSQAVAARPPCSLPVNDSYERRHLTNSKNTWMWSATFANIHSPRWLTRDASSVWIQSLILTTRINRSEIHSVVSLACTVWIPTAMTHLACIYERSTVEVSKKVYQRPCNLQSTAGWIQNFGRNGKISIQPDKQAP